MKTTMKIQKAVKKLDKRDEQEIKKYVKEAFDRYELTIRKLAYM